MLRSIPSALPVAPDGRQPTCHAKTCAASQESVPTRIRSGPRTRVIMAPLPPSANAVRAIDVFADELDLGELGFGGVQPHATSRPTIQRHC